jgi:serine/threonine protein kinase
MSSLKKYRRVKYLGKGSYGAAILVELRSDPSKKFVIKEIVIGHLKPAEQASAKGEADVLHQMNHSNITMYVESFVENSKLYIVMEHADGGDLSGTIQKRKSEGNFYAEDEVMRIFVQICLALKHVHAANILHRDLKSQNIFLTLKGMVKLGDFGIAKVLDASDGQAATQIGTPYYLSPEICESKPYGRKSDVWSLGVVLYEIIALEMPFQAQSLPALVVKICSGEPNYTLVATKYSPALIALTRSMLQKNPDKRPSLSQIVKTDFIMNHISKLLSYTIKMGNGGVVNVNPLLLPSDVQFKDADEADRNIELEKVRQRDQEGKDKDSVKRLEEREKLRRFKQDRVAESRQGANGIADVEESKDGRARGRSPARERGVSPVRGGRAASPVRQRSPVRGGGVESPKRGNSPTRSNRDAAPQRQYDRNVGPAPKVAPNPAYPVQQPVAIGRGRSLAEIQQDRQRDSAMEAMRRGGAVDSSYNGGGRHSHGGADDRGAMVVAKGRENQYENAARR